MGQITNNGVQSRTLQEWYAAVVAFKQKVWGQNYVTDPTTKQGTDIVELSELLYNAEQNNISAYSQLNINTAVGINLDYIGIIRGISRNGGAPQELTVKITSNTTGYNITPSIVFRTLDGLYSYSVPANISITALEQEITLIYSQDGDPDVSDGDSLRTVEYFPNIISAVIVPGGVKAGTETESDASYRQRLLDAEIGFIGTLELMQGEMLQVPGLAKSSIYSNDSDTTDSRGITPYSTEFVVAPNEVPATDAFKLAVANKICDIKVPGAPLYGQITQTIPNYMGEEKNIKFTVATRKDVQFYAKIAANNQTGYLDTSAVPVHQQAVMDYVNSNNKIGGTVNWSTILGIVAADSGYLIVEWGLRFKGDSAWTNSNLATDIREYAWVDSVEDIQISPDPAI